MTLAIVESSSGAASASATKAAITSGVAGRNSIPPTIVPTSWRRNCSRVATPKLPPPPRSAQNRSGWCSASTRSELAVGGDDLGGEQVVDREAVLAHEEADAAAERDAADPDRARVAEPGREAVRAGGGGVLAARSGPVSAQAVRRSGSISSARIAERSSTIPPSETPWPAGLWPPPRTASSSPLSRASAMTRATSAASAARTIMAGRRSTAPEKTVRACRSRGPRG